MCVCCSVQSLSSLRVGLWYDGQVACEEWRKEEGIECVKRREGKKRGGEGEEEEGREREGGIEYIHTEEREGREIST